MNWLESLFPERNINLSKRDQSIEYFSMYRGKKKKVLLSKSKFKVLQLKDLLILEVNPLINTSVIFLEDEGTRIVLVRDDKVIDEFIHPFIKPSMIVDNGGLIPDAFKNKYKELIEEEFNISFFDQKEYNKLNSVEKLYYVEKTLDLSHVIVYKLLI